MTIQYSDAHRTASMNDLVTKCGTSAIIKLFSGSVPANNSVADTGTMLVSITANSVAFGTVANGVLTVSGTPLSNTAVASNTATYFRIYPSAITTTNAVIQGNVATSGADLNLNSTAIVSGQAVTLSSIVLTSTGA